MTKFRKASGSQHNINLWPLIRYQTFLGLEFVQLVMRLNPVARAIKMTEVFKICVFFLVNKLMHYLKKFSLG